jgi:HAUS augmin-like complex subunit 6
LFLLGDRFHNLLVHFSDYVLTQVTHREGGRFAQSPPVPLINSTNFTLTPVMAKAIMCHSQRERQRFLDSGQQLVAAQQEWISFAMELTRECRKLSRSVREQNQKMESYIASQRDKLLVGSSNPRNVPSGSRSAEFYLEMARKQRVAKLQQVRKHWQRIELFHKNHLAEHKVIQSILDGNAQKYKVDATDIELQVPAVLLPECQQQVEKGELSNLYHNGKLDLLSLVQLWGLSLDLLKDKLHESGVPDFSGLQAEIATLVHTHHGQLADAQAIRAALSQLLPQLRQSIAALDAHLDSEVKAFQQQKSQATPSRHSRKGTFRISV